MRNATAYASYEVAVEALNGVDHKIGQPVVAVYQATEGEGEGATVVNRLLLAVGKGNAKGASSYEIVANEADLKALLSTVTELNASLVEHKEAVAGNGLGHIKKGGDIEISSEGVVTVPELENKAPIESPEFTGTPLAPTAAAGTDSTQVATTAFVQKEINDKLAASHALAFKGTLGTDGTVTALPADASVGDTYVATEGAPNVGDEVLEPGDMVICVAAAGEDSDAEWTVVQTNIDGAVTGPTSSVDGNIAVFDGSTGKVIKDSGIDPTTLAAKAIKVQAGEGLEGGGTLAADIEISHAAAPEAADGTAVGGEGDYVSGIKIDKFGHIAEVTKSTLPVESGKVKVVAGDEADYLNTKFATNGDVTDNEVAVEFDKNEDNKIIGKVTINVIDGGTY